MTRAAKIAVTIDDGLLKRLDAFVKNKTFDSRSQAVQSAVISIVERLEHKRLIHECKKLNIDSEQAMADENLEEDLNSWPDY